MIATKTATKATHRTTLKYTGEVGDRTAPRDRARKFITEAVQMIQDSGQIGALIIHFGDAGNVRGMVFEETQTVPQRDIHD